MTSSAQIVEGTLQGTGAGAVAPITPPLPEEPLVARRPGLSPLGLRVLVATFDTLITALSFLGATAITTASMADINALPKRLPVVCAAMILGLTIQGAYQFKKIRNG